MRPQENKIRAFIAAEQEIRIDVHDELPSTNLAMSSSEDEYQQGQSWLVVTNSQTSGIGRRGKYWQSSAGNITFSLLSYFPCPPAKLAGLSLVAGLSVVSVLEQELDVYCQLKWPNDIIVNQAKLAGLLIELKTQSSRANYAITGIGINYSPLNQQSYDQAVISLSDLPQPLPSRDLLIGKIVDRLIHNYQRYLQHGLAAFVEEYRLHDYLLGKPVKLLLATHEHLGVAKGISSQGELLVAIAGQVQSFNAGEVSVRRL